MTKSMMTRWILILLSKVKGKNKFSGSCYICGKVGHKSTECWSRDTVSNKGSGGHQNANVTSSGKGKSVGQGAEGAKRHQRSRQEQGQRQVEIQRQKGVSERQTRRFLEFEEESWEETNETEQVKWWNSWTEDMEPRRDEAPLGAFMVGGTEFELNSFKTASGEILPDEGQLMWPCFLQEGRKCWLRGHVTDVQRPLISAGKVLGKDKVAILHSGGRFDLLLELTHRKLDFKSTDEGHEASTIRRAHQVVQRGQHLQFLREGFRWKLASAKL